MLLMGGFRSVEVFVVIGEGGWPGGVVGEWR